MEKLTKDFREAEIARIDKPSPFKTQIQLHNEHGETRWISIDEVEFHAIWKILTGRKFHV